MDESKYDIGEFEWPGECPEPEPGRTEPPPIDRDVRRPNWVFTYNYPTEAEEYHVESLFDDRSNNIRHIVFGRELNSTGGRHLQGYIRFAESWGWNHVVKLLSLHKDHLAWVQPMSVRSSPEHCYNYCTKEYREGYGGHGTFGPMFERGELCRQQRQRGRRGRERTKFDVAFEYAKEGKFEEIERGLYIRHKKVFHEIHLEDRDIPEYRDDKICFWVYGKTGTGKTTWARREYEPETKAYIKSATTKWWCQYLYEDKVIIEDFPVNPKEADMIDNLKLWSDKYSCRVEMKGSSVIINPRILIVTSNYSIDQLETTHENRMALKSRFVEIRKNRQIVSHRIQNMEELVQKYSDPPEIFTSCSNNFILLE